MKTVVGPPWPTVGVAVPSLPAPVPHTHSPAVVLALSGGDGTGERVVTNVGENVITFSDDGDGKSEFVVTKMGENVLRLSDTVGDGYGLFVVTRIGENANVPVGSPANTALDPRGRAVTVTVTISRSVTTAQSLEVTYIVEVAAAVVDGMEKLEVFGGNDALSVDVGKESLSVHVRKSSVTVDAGKDGVNVAVRRDVPVLDGSDGSLDVTEGNAELSVDEGSTAAEVEVRWTVLEDPDGKNTKVELTTPLTKAEVVGKTLVVREIEAEGMVVWVTSSRSTARASPVCNITGQFIRWWFLGPTWTYRSR